MDKSKKKSKFIKLIFAFFLLFLGISIISFPLKTVNYNIYNSKINSNFKIAHISDVHSCYYGKNMKNLITAIDSERPDIIVFTGDIFDDELDNSNTLTLLKSISNRYPCYYVAGNHEDVYSGWPDAKKQLEKMSIKVLEGSTYILNGEITISGAAKSSDKQISFDESVKMCSENITDKTFNILLAHYPSKIDYYSSFNKFDLILSGHEHGGQLRIPFLVNGIYAPDEGLLPAYAGGYYKEDNCEMIVSRGLSRTKNLIPRIFNNSQQEFPSL